MNTNKLLRHINAVRSLRLLSRGQTLSRADMARELGLTRATVGNAISVLSDAGFTEEESGGAANGRKGRPGIGVRLKSDGAYFLGIDIGTKVITYVVADLTMNVVARRVEPAGPEFRNPDHIAGRLFPTAMQLLGEAGLGHERVQGLCVSVPGLIGRDGRVVNAPFLEWRDFPLRARVMAAFPKDWNIIVCNDAFAFANAERAALSHIGEADMFLILLAEGIGGATISDGRVFGGAHGYAGEVGHIQITVKGKTDSFEMLAGAKYFAHHFRSDEAVEEGVRTLLDSAEDAEISQALDHWAHALATGLANVVHLLDPGKVVLGGPIAALFPIREALVVDRLEAALLPGCVLPTISVAKFGADGAAIGAAATVREQLFVLPDLDGSPVTPLG